MSSQRNNPLNLSLLGGHIIECFDNTLYGFFAVMLVPLYFPSTVESVGYLASYGTFAAGFLARPLGAAYFGWLGDRVGRRTPLLRTMVWIGIPTALIGLTPSYDSIGLMAPLLLVLFRLSQGFFWGGEFTGVNLYILESQQQHTLGRKTGTLIGFGVLGAIVASMVGAFFTMQVMPSWAWRVPFILGGLSTLLVYWARRQLVETLDFEQVKKHHDILPAVWPVLLRDYKQPLLLTMVIAGLTVMPLYAATILSNRLFKTLGYTTTESMLLNMAAMVLDACLLLFVVGRMADYLGFRRQMLLGSLSVAAVSFPAYYLVSGPEVTLMQIYVFIIMLISTGTIINGCAMPYVSRCFPTNCRYTAVAMAVTLGHALLGGTMPLIGTLLTTLFDSAFAPAFWLCAIALIAAGGIYTLDAKSHKHHHVNKPKKVHTKRKLVTVF